jgi:hypothetical protein
MRPVFAFAFVEFLLAAFGSAATPHASRPVTLILQFDGDYDEQSVQQMERELSKSMKPAGFSFSYQLRSDYSPAEAVPELIMVRFIGSCRMNSSPGRREDPTVLASTHRSDGRVLPFTEVACDHIRSLIAPLLDRDDKGNADRIFGRALGRVLAHEIYHVLAGTSRHTGWGVTQARLSGRDLIVEILPMDHGALTRMQQGSAPSP